MKKLMLALAAVIGFSVSALAVETVSNDAMSAVITSSTEPSPGGYGGGGEKPEGDPPEGEPPEKPREGDEGGEGGGTGGGGSEDTATLTGAWQYDSGTNTLIRTEAVATLSSSNSDENVVLAQTNGTKVTISNLTLNKSGDCSSEDNSNFFAVNAVVAAKKGALICIDNATLNSNAKGANCLFASGDDSTIYAYKCALTSTKDSSRGLDATYEGTVIGSKLTIDTTGDHCAALATDRGNGSISVTEATLSTAGQGSPLIYSTGVIEVNGVTGTATGAQIAGIEGLSAIRIKNSDLSGSGEKASEPVANGVIIYQSGSGDSTEGKATFEVSESTLTSAITNGAMFYITHSEADIVVQNADLNFDTAQNYLLKAAGNDGSNGWGTAGSNGAEVVFAAIDQTLAGNVSVDGISTLSMYLTNTTYTGTFVQDTTYTGSNGVNVCISSDSTWIVTANCTLQSLTAAAEAQIVDGSGNPVPVVGASNETLRPGTSALKITVTTYASEEVATPLGLTDFEISRSDFESTYSYYFKPHPPENAIVKVRYGETLLKPDMDHKYWVTDYWMNGITVTITYATKNGYSFLDGSKETNWVCTITQNKVDVYPPNELTTVLTSVTPGKATESYDDAQSATNAAAMINADKTDYINIPKGVEDSDAKATYLSKVEATVTDDNRVVVDLTAAAEVEVQSAIDEAVTNETVVAALTTTNASAKVTVSPTTPGLYYWILGGTDVGAVTNAGSAKLSPNGGSVELSKPTLDATQGKAFFKVSAGVSAPAQKGE